MNYKINYSLFTGSFSVHFRFKKFKIGRKFILNYS